MGRRRGGRRRRRRREMAEDDNDDGGPSRRQMKTIVNYATMTTDIKLKFDKILDKMKRFIGNENYQNIYTMEVKTRMKEMIKVLQEKEPENCLQILVHVLVECGCLKNTGWKEKPDPISALQYELREPILVIERLVESVKKGHVDKVKQLLSQYPIPQHMEHITRECCVLSVNRRDLPLVKFIHIEYRSMLDNAMTLKHMLNEAVGVDFTKGVRFLFSRGLHAEENIFYIELIEKAKSTDMLERLLSEEKIRKSLNDVPWFTESIYDHQILHSSTQPDCMSRVQILVDAGARVESLIVNRERALLKMIKERWLQVFDYLVNRLKGMIYTNRDKQNILHVILVREGDGDVRNNILDFVRKLVERGIDINSVDKEGQSPLMLSCRAGYYDVVKYLIERRADVNKVDNNGQTVLMLACERGHKHVMEYLVQHGRADVNKIDKYGKTVLMWACVYGNKPRVEFLIQKGRADVNKEDKYGGTALILACFNGYKDIVEYLVREGRADVNKVNIYGRTALMVAYREGHKEIVEYLIRDGRVDVNMVDRYGQTALMLACREGNKEIVEYLIQHGRADVNKGDNDGCTALMLACMGGHKDIVEYLIQDGRADVNKVDNEGQTALMLACDRGYEDISKYLSERGADVNMVNV